MHSLGIVAQLVEQGPFKAKVAGSSPANPTICHEKPHESGVFKWQNFGYGGRESKWQWMKWAYEKSYE